MTGIVIGYDPGGNGKHGVARATLRDGDILSVTTTTCNVVEDVVASIVNNETPLGLGVDTLTCWATGHNGWRPADRWLRQRYDCVQNSVVAPNSLYGAMSLSGMALLVTVRQAFPDLFVTETHPKVQDLNDQARHWLDHVANVRTHGTLKERPVDRFEHERDLLRPLASRPYRSLVLPPEVTKQAKAVLPRIDVGTSAAGSVCPGGRRCSVKAAGSRRDRIRAQPPPSGCDALEPATGHQDPRRLRRISRSASPLPRLRAGAESTTVLRPTSSPRSKKPRPPASWDAASRSSPILRSWSSTRSATCRSARPAPCSSSNSSTGAMSAHPLC